MKQNETEKKQNKKEQEKINPPHTKKYSFQENYNFITTVWEKVAQKPEYTQFLDFQADDLINFFEQFIKIEDQKQFFTSNREFKRFIEIRQQVFRKYFFKEALQMKKDSKSKEFIINHLKQGARILDQKQIDRLIKDYEKYH